ncbi:M20/M25/M40 family metallo-hydrolase [Sphingosinithalassobacter portus]|uniref:M20/M25/M40 family metallo-hydrolase n=1 Tax=Stakelama portus TaxID=2676234 RepID=UPI000D6E68EF
MNRHLLLAAAAALALPATLHAQTMPIVPDADVSALRDAALQDEYAWDLVEGLTTEVGPRLAGTEAEARARSWAEAHLKGMGFANVHIETYQMPVWERGVETAHIVSPFPQALTLTALGRSAATPPEGIEAEVVYFPTFAEMMAAPAEAIRGKIVFVSNDMVPTQDGSGYGANGAARFVGPSFASQKGAVAMIIKSIGTDSHRTPHTGGTNFAEGVAPIPAAALSVPDAEQLERVFERGQPVRLHLTLTPRDSGMQESGNVIAEVPGSDPDAGIVLIACHLDSWDLGTGAIDDAAGCGIVAAAARHIMEAGQPRRTIRILFAGAEEVGVFGGDAYYEAHKSDPVVLVSESDFGADRVWRVTTNLPGDADAVGKRVAAALAPLGIVAGSGKAGGGADVGEFARNGTAVIDLDQDGTRYFDLHHTPDDTLDKIDPEQLRQNVAAWTAMLAVVANAPEAIGPVADAE